MAEAGQGPERRSGDRRRGASALSRGQEQVPGAPENEGWTANLVQALGAAAVKDDLAGARKLIAGGRAHLGRRLPALEPPRAPANLREERRPQRRDGHGAGGTGREEPSLSVREPQRRALSWRFDLQRRGDRWLIENLTAE